MELDYDKVTEERKALREKIEEQGAGAPTRWMTMAESASVGNKAAKSECVRLLGHPITSMLDLFNIQRAAFDAATVAEQNRSAADAAIKLNARHNVRNDANEYLANRLWRLRKEKRLTQKELAQKAGIPLVTLQKLENGSASLLRARVETARALARALEITVEELVDA